MSQPVTGYILSIGLNLPVPLAMHELVAQGLEVHKVEPPQGDPLKQYFPQWYQKLHRGQYVTVLELPKELKAFQQKLQQASVLVTCNRPSWLQKININWSQLQKDFPQLSWVEVTGFEEPDKAGHDINFQAQAGLISNGQVPSTLAVDLVGSKQIALTCLSILYQAHLKDRGVHKHITLEGCADFLAQPLNYTATVPTGLLGGGHPCYSIYACSDGPIALGALEPKFQKNLAAFTKDLDKNTLIIFFKNISQHEAVTMGSDHDIPITAVKSWSKNEN